MLVGGWGAQAAELLARASERRGAEVHRIDRLAMSRPPDAVAERWCYWIFGEPEDRGTLATDFGLEAPSDLPAAFARALTKRGDTACELLCGRFVVVTFERERDRLLVTRDQLGAQPLVYTHIGDGVLFAEHERDLLKLLARTPSPDRLALLQWIENGLAPHGHTLYESVHRLPAGHRLTADKTHTSVERWWSLRYESIERESTTALAERVREAAFAAVARATSGAQRPALKLSGGLDSACVAAALASNGLAGGRARALGGAFSAFPGTDESELIEATARHTHLPLELIAFDPCSSMLAPALAHIARWRLPPATPNLFLWQPMMARARELEVDLMLDGEGGDELFGCAPQLIADRLRAGWLASAWSLTSRTPGVGLNPGSRRRMRALRRYGLSPLMPRTIRRRRDRRAIAASSNSIVPPADAQALADMHMASHEHRRDGPLWWQYLAGSLIDTRDLLDMGGHFRRTDADEQIERRHPLLYDLQLIETMLSLPPAAQFDPVRDRPLLRDALAGLIPEAVRTRHAKSYFTPLVLAGLRADESGLIEPLRRPDAPVRSYVAQPALDRKVALAPDHRPMFDAGSVWRIAIANLWLMYASGDS